MKDLNRKNISLTTMRISQDEKELIDKIQDLTGLKQVNVCSLILSAGIEALRQSVTDRIELPLRFEVANYGNRMATEVPGMKKARKNGLKEVPVEGFEPPTKGL